MVVLEVAISLLATWPLIFQLSFLPFRRRSPLKVVRNVALLGGYLLVLVFAAVFFPPLLHFIAVCAGLLLLWERWQARPGYGRSRGLPPGSLGLCPPGVRRDPRFFEKQIAKFGPIFKTRREFEPLVCIYGHKKGLQFLQEHDDVLRGIPMPFSRHIPKGFLRYMDPSDHTKYRRVFSSAITPQTIDRSIPAMLIAIREALNRIAADCQASPTGKVDPDDYLREMMYSAFLPLFFGFEKGSSPFGEARVLYEGIDVRGGFWDTDHGRRRATDELMALVGRQAAAYADSPEPGDEGPTSLLKNLVDVDPDSASDKTVLGNLIYMGALGGLADLANLTRWILKVLMEHPECLQRLREMSGDTREEVERQRDQAGERIAKETLRLHQMEFLLRKSTTDILFEGFRIPKNWSIRLCIREANRDAQVFVRPEAFDPDRFLDRTYSNVEYAPFGLYRHNCLGAFLTLRFCTTFILEISQGFNLEPASDWPTKHGRAHWEPKRGYQISLRQRTDEPQRKVAAKVSA